MSGQLGIYQPRLTVPILDAPRIAPTGDAIAAGLDQNAQVFDQLGKQRDATELIQARMTAQQKLADVALETQRQPWQVRDTYFQGQAQGILSDITSGFSDPKLAAQFAPEWQQLELSHSINIKESMFAGEKDQNVANLNTSLDDFARQAAEAPTEEQANAFRQQAAGQIAAGVGGGWITDTEGGDLLRNVARGIDKNRLRAMIDTPALGGPNAAMAALADNSKFTNLKAEDRIMLQERADSKMQHLMAVADHQIIISERNKRIAGDAAMKDALDLVTAGQMTEGKLQEIKPVLSPSDYGILRHTMQEGGTTDSASAITNINQKIYVNGEDAAPDIMAALNAHQITGATAKSFLDENKTAQGTPQSRAKAFVTQYLQPSQLNEDPAAKQHFAEAMAEFSSRLQQNPKQDPMDLARDVVRRNAIIDFQKMSLVMPLPTYFVGSRSDLTGTDPKPALQAIEATRQATNKEFLAKHNGDQAAVQADPAYQKEALTLKKWRDNLNALAASNAATAVPPGQQLK